MSQATANTYGYGNESISVGSKPVASGVDKESIFETMKPLADRMSVELLEEYKAKLTSAQEKIRDLKDTCADQSVELYKIKKENEELYMKLKEKEETGTTLDFYPIYDPRMYTDEHGNHPTARWVRNLWDTLYILSTNTLENGCYYIENATSAFVVYKILHESNRIAYKFTAKYDDFSTTWNANLASRHAADRVALLTCKGDSIKALYNNEIWKGVSIGSIELNRNLNATHEKSYRSANCIITHVMPAICALAAG